jgi:hypothetical protein
MVVVLGKDTIGSLGIGRRALASTFQLGMDAKRNPHKTGRYT